METNVDLSEVKQFDALASRWWDRDGPCKPLHDLNPLRLQFIEQHAPLFEKKVLDVGCGGGILTESLAKAGAHVAGIDLAIDALKVADLHQKTLDLGIDYQCCSVEGWAAGQAEHYDVITCMEMLEHVPDPMSIVHACATLIKPGGKVFFSTLNRHPLAYLKAIIGAEYVLNLLPRGTHDYAKFIKPAELAAWGRGALLECTALKGLTYNPFSKQYKLTKNVDTNYLVCMTKS